MLVPMGESVMLRRRRWRVFSSVSSELMCAEAWVGQLRALLVGSRWRGRRVKVSRSMWLRGGERGGQRGWVVGRKVCVVWMVVLWRGRWVGAVANAGGVAV